MTEMSLNIPARVHISLLDMSVHGYRRHGGLGFALENGYVCRAKISQSQRFIDKRNGCPSNVRQVAKLQQLMKDLLNSDPELKPIEFSIISGFDAHNGFGSGTALRLAAIEALLLLNERDATVRQVMHLSGRGGVSGIGVNTYFSGGFWLDAGIKNTQNLTFMSSDDQQMVTDLPLPLVRVTMPEDWIFGVCVPSANSELCEDESKFFSSFIPPSVESVWNLVYEAAFGVLPSVLEKDKNTFCASMSRIQSCYWKSAERAYHAAWLRSVKKILEPFGVDELYLSSFGPGVFFLSSDAMVRGITKRADMSINWLKVDNSGRQLIYA